MKVAPEKETQAVIMDGKILDKPLDDLNLSRSWLKGELEKQGLTVENVFLGQVDSYGELTVDLYADKVQVPQPQDKPQLYALLKNAKRIWSCSVYPPATRKRNSCTGKARTNCRSCCRN